ncbi:DNA-binding protein [Nocardia stercoris]|uniref:DNA-binding protein n=2 Tax=Nocardia stercoris TaxID=2483361 RepID=A0A3M2LC52_9NOCA|nr:DNA-binding protein [Nocardia stercoris]
MSGVGVAEAAAVLGVQPQAVRKMLREGLLEYEPGLRGIAVVVSSASLARLQAMRARGSGRPWSERTAWAGIDLLSGGSAGWLTPQARYRLRRSVEQQTADEFLWSARRRASVYRYRGDAEAVPLIAAHVIPTAASAVADDARVAAAFGLAGGSGIVDGYVPAGVAQQISAAYALAEDPGGNIVLREVTFTEPLANGTPMPAIALDLADSPTTRERSAGMRYLEGVLAHGRSS